MSQQLSAAKYLVKGSLKYAFVASDAALVYKDQTGSKMVTHLLFGDYVKILDTNIQNGRVRVSSRNEVGWISADSLQQERVLEVNFVDIGQGDGCHVVTPDDKHIIIDAGEFDNMNRYLTWRFNLYRKTKSLAFPFIVVISHSDKDHYKGFQYIFDNPLIRINTVYHNGIVERPGKYRLGNTEGDYIVEVVNDTASMKQLITDENNLKGTNSMYCVTLNKALKGNKGIQFKALSQKNKALPGFGGGNTVNGKRFEVKILGPLLEDVNGKEALRSFKNPGVDKNGHSVLMRLDYGNMRLLLGGDINDEFGNLIHAYYKKKRKLKELQVDVAKACHHGSNKFHYPFVKDVNAAATVISSGDNEQYSHPRPDAIGAFGKCGYGDRPLVFSTELARSNKEFRIDTFKEIAALLTKLKKYDDLLLGALGVNEKEDILAKKRITNKDINSFLTRYGMINVRTDGMKLIIAQKLEVYASNRKWDIHKLQYNEQTKRFELV